MYCKRLKIYNNVGLGGDINNNGDIQYQMIACVLVEVEIDPRRDLQGHLTVHILECTYAVHVLVHDSNTYMYYQYCTLHTDRLS